MVYSREIEKFLMDMLKKLFPFAFTAKADAAALVITFLDYFKVFK